MKALDSFLHEIHAHSLFPDLKKEIENDIPEVPDWKPNEDIELWKYQSALREGYFRALRHIKISENKK